MGDYVFTDATSGDKVRVEYTFCYKRCEDGIVRICLHHSSVPYSPQPAPLTEAEVLEAQALWANQIAAISKVYADQVDQEPLPPHRRERHVLLRRLGGHEGRQVQGRGCRLRHQRRPRLVER